MEIRYAEKFDIDQLVYLWKKCFPDDTEDYIRFFYNENADKIKTLCGFFGGELAGMINLIPADVMMGGKRKNALYGYAIGVLPEYRGKGVFKELHRSLCEYILKNEMIYILSPENEKLADYYESCGMRRSCYIKKREHYIRLDEMGRAFDNSKKDVKISDIDASEYSLIRSLKFKDACVMWDADSIKYAINEKHFCGGFAKLIEYNGRRCAIIGDITRDAVIINEAVTDDMNGAKFGIEAGTMTDSGSFDLILPLIAEYFGKSKIVVFSEDPSGKGTLNGMTVGYDGSAGNIYLSLTLG